jgi:hypothetical protein
MTTSAEIRQRLVAALRSLTSGKRRSRPPKAAGSADTELVGLVL